MKTYVYCINGEDVEIAVSNREEADKIARYKRNPQAMRQVSIQRYKSGYKVVINGGKESFYRPNKLAAGMTATAMRSFHKTRSTNTDRCPKLSLKVKGTTDTLGGFKFNIKPKQKIVTYELNDNGRKKLARMKKDK